jgi:hypothetical protein
MNAPSVIPQQILNLCTISIATCNKIFNLMTPFNGDKIRPRVTARAGGKTFSWLFDTGASVTCMTANSFNTAFPHYKPRRVQNVQHCTAASGNKMHSLGIFEIDLEIKGKKYQHQINLIDQLTDNIIGIDFMHQHKLHYVIQTRQVKIAGVEFNQIIAIKEQTLPALTLTVITAKYKGKVTKDNNYISPRTPMLSGMPAIISINKNNNCKIVLDNCTPYNVTISRNDILGIMEAEPDEPIPMEDSTISAILQDLENKLPKIQKRKLTKDFGFRLPILRQKSTQMYSTTLKHVFSANKGNLPPTSHLFCNLYQFQTGPTSRFTLTCLAPCSQPDVSTNTSSASRMPSPNTRWSRQWRTRKLKLWQKPFFRMVL